MNFLTSNKKTPMQLTLMFLVLLPLAYVIYFSFAREYGSLLMMISSNIVASIFDMHVITNGSYLENVTLISNNGLQNNISHEIAYAKLPLTKLYIDKIMIVITNTPIILALSLLLVRRLKVLISIILTTLLIHTVSVSSTLLYFMFEVSPQSSILMTYLQAIGVTQSVIDISYIFSGISYFYLKYFTPLAIAYYAWESHSYSLLEVKNEIQSFSLSNLKLSFIFNKKLGN